METTDSKDFKERLLEIWKSRQFQVFLDVLRVLTFILLIFIIYTLITEIETVKMLNHDPCALCMEKTGCSCFCGSGLLEDVEVPDFGLDEFRSKQGIGDG